MFCIETVDPDERDIVDEAEYYCERREDNDRNLVINNFAMYAITLVDDLKGFIAERDQINLPLDHDAPPVIPQQLRLRAIFGGLATIFPNTTSVESDFSILEWELDELHTAIMHLSLEEIF
ncbi:unnamed protein product [Hyaloperonospora brassicae]|uniref:HAT C-terminal dimerisation domain-containing protein n=1 Tax=Hyaloperonospora brassicae TaxID=162125 RepID=A0AAV0UQF2_HYABA|nr:unnamed protein product [Hyaloperonospora brassicae]